MSQKTTNEREREREDTYVLNDPHLRGASWSALELQTDEKRRDGHFKNGTRTLRTESAPTLLCYANLI